jgi:hypothetical protein
MRIDKQPRSVPPAAPSTGLALVAVGEPAINMNVLNNSYYHTYL